MDGSEYSASLLFPALLAIMNAVYQPRMRPTGIVAVPWRKLREISKCLRQVSSDVEDELEMSCDVIEK